jgi:hypothetical protein
LFTWLRAQGRGAVVLLRTPGLLGESMTEDLYDVMVPPKRPAVAPAEDIYDVLPPRAAPAAKSAPPPPPARKSNQNKKKT